MIKRYTKQDYPLIKERVFLVKNHLDECNESYEKCIEPYQESAIAYPFHRMFATQINAKNEASERYTIALRVLDALENSDEVLLEHFEQEILGL